MTEDNKILYVCHEIDPYVQESEMGQFCRELSQGMQEKGSEIRTFMPRYGSINERRNQLHEVIRLSGMNLIIDDNDHQLVIKVASIPSARVQVYFIDNDDYFGRRAELVDEKGVQFEDNDERAIFYARGVLETVKKLMWKPTIVHCHGWFSALVPIYLKQVLADDPLFKSVKVVVSVYDDEFEGELNAKFIEKVENEGVKREEVTLLEKPNFENVMRLAIENSDAVILESKKINPTLASWIEKSGKKILEYQDRTAENYLERYHEFYERLR